MKFKVGDRVIHKRYKTKLFIKDLGLSYYCVKKICCVEKIYGFECTLFVEEELLELDKQWYREQKINSLLDEIQSWR